MVVPRCWHQHGRLLARTFCFVMFAAVTLLSNAFPLSAQAVKASVARTSLNPTQSLQWVYDLGYRKNEVYPLTLNDLGCPFLNVDAAGVTLSLMLDSGTSRGMIITNSAPRVPYRIAGRNEELNADGSHRGESVTVSLDAVSVLGKVFKNVKAAQADWHMFSSVPFDGTVGLDFFLDRRVTLDYRSKRVAVTSSSAPLELDHRRYLTLDLVDPPDSQGHVLYARARVAGREAMIYLDTGYNVSFISPDFAVGLPVVERPGRFKVFRQAVSVELDGNTLTLDDLRESVISRGTGFGVPVALVFGSDILSRFIVTIDLRTKKLILALAG